MTIQERLRRFSTPVILVGIALAVGLLAEFRNDIVFERVVTVMFINLLLVVGLQTFMGNSGLGSFGHYAFVTVGAYASIWFSLTPQQKTVALPDMPKEWWLYDQHYPFLVAAFLGAIIAAILGAVVGVAFVRLRGASFTIATFAFLVVVNRVALQWEEVTRGSRTVIGIPKETTLWMAFSFAAAGIVVAFIFKESTVGLKLRASRSDEDAAASVGVNVKLMRWIAWVLSVFLSGLGGALWAHFIQQFSPHNFYLKETFLIIAMLVIGGAASVSGAVVGTVSVALLMEQLRQMENWVNLERQSESTIGNLIPIQFIGFTEIIIALSMIIVLIVRPSGLMGGKELQWPMRRRPPSTPAESTPAPAQETLETQS